MASEDSVMHGLGKIGLCKAALVLHLSWKDLHDPALWWLSTTRMQA